MMDGGLIIEEGTPEHFFEEPEHERTKQFLSKILWRAQTERRWVRVSATGGWLRVAGLVFDEVTKVYADGTKAVDSLELEISDGEFMVLVGPSGCGKTTALRMVAGLEEISGGAVRIGDRVVNHVPSRDRDIAMVFQSYALYPHLSVYDNIAFGLRVKKVPKEEIERRVRNAAEILGLEPFLKRKPRALSGGQRQRVAMGRAIVREPAAFLMDEPLSNLDAKLRVQMRAEVSRLQRNLGTTTLYVTHDQVEAMTMGDRVAVMRKGELQQVADPQTLYDRPVNLFVGGFIGSPAMNMLEATVTQSNGGLAVDVGKQHLTLDESLLAAKPALRSYEGRKIILGIRPEELEDVSLEPDTPPGQRLRGVVELREALGSELMVHFTVEGTREALTEDVKELAQDAGAPGGPPALESTGSGALLVGRFGARASVEEGKPVEVAVDTRALHFFDEETSEGIYDGDTSEKGASA
jgi:multiple sugar transport system ATP-binding protein